MPSWIESSVGGTLASGGIGKGSLKSGMVIDHVESLVVVTGDGRRVACSKKQAGWLFEAVLAGQGRFGVIAEATLRLEEKPRSVRRETRIVDANDVANALADSAVVHASACSHDGRFRVLCTYSTDEGAGALAIADFLSPPLFASKGPQQIVRAQLDPAGLARVLGNVRDLATGETVWVHPVRERKDRTGLLLLRNADRDGALVFHVQRSRATDPRADAPDQVTSPWAKIAGPERAELALRAKDLADPRHILGSAHHFLER